MAGKIKARTPQQIGRASKQKGTRFELEIAHYLQEHGYPNAHRTAQHCGKTGDAGDVEGVPNLHIECKHVENMTYGDVVDRIIAGQMDHSPEFMCLENGMIYRNQTQAARELGIGRSNLNEVLAGVRKAAKGLTFRWLYQMAA